MTPQIGEEHQQRNKTPLPLVIFLHGYAYQLGFTGIYGLLGSSEDGGVINAIAARGIAVLAWDQTGMGARQSEGGATFYRRSGGKGSRLGAMVAEIQSALEFVRCTSVASESDPTCLRQPTGGAYPSLHVPPLDSSKVFLVGYSMGAAVALHAAAVLPPSQIAGVGVVGGWTPMRANGGNVTTGGNRMIYETHALIPRLGLFAGRVLRRAVCFVVFFSFFFGNSVGLQSKFQYMLTCALLMTYNPLQVESTKSHTTMTNCLQR